MTKLKDIVKFLDQYLETDKFEEWNGLQIEGKTEVRKIMFAVDASIDTFKKAISEKADMIIVHHGLFWKTANPSYIGFYKERIDLLLKNKISLYASHLPLDRHREAGNNAQLLKLLGSKIKKEFFKYGNLNIGWIGECKNPITIKYAAEKLKNGLNAKCVILPFGKEKIKTIAVCSGGGGYESFFEAFNNRNNCKIDLYLSGEAIDIYSLVKDAKFNVIFAGHHATETTGLKALSKVVAKKFRTKNVFIDIPTGL
jgi:dinuclear metal center YbgI/SA1388 family protein